MSAPTTPLVLIVDDEEKILSLVAAYLEAQGYRTLTAQTGAQAFDRLRNHDVSLVLLDLMLPDITGEEICERVRESSQTPVIMMTAKVDEESVIGGLSKGADDYITKPFSPRQLVARISAVLRRSAPTQSSTSIVHRDGITLDLLNQRVLKSGEPVDLTASEYRIVALLMQNPHRIFSRAEIINNLSSDNAEVYDRAIDSHMKNLRRKIEQDPKHPQCIQTVYGMGYRWGGTTL